MALDCTEPESIDSALLSALGHPKNRDIVLDFERQVLRFLTTEENSLIFPLTLSGYQRLLAHRTAQHHGLQTETIADESENHGKIRASRNGDVTIPNKEKLSEATVPVAAAEESREAPKTLKKKIGPDRPRPRDAQSDGVRAPVARLKSFTERNAVYSEERARILGSYTDLPGRGPRNGSDAASSEFAKATFKNREQDMRDPDYQRNSRYPQPYGGEVRYRPYLGEGPDVDQMAQMFQNFSFQHVPDNSGLAYPAHPNAMPMGAPYGPMHVSSMPYGYQTPMIQQFPQGMYGNASMPYGYQQIPQQQFAHYPQGFMTPYAYMPMRTNGVMPPYGGQQMGQSMMPYNPYQPPFIQQQGYNVAGPSPQGGRPAFGSPRAQAYQPRPVPTNGSYGRRPHQGPNNRPATKSESPVRAVESPTAAVSAAQNPGQASESLSTIQTSPQPPQPDTPVQNGDKDQA